MLKSVLSISRKAGGFRNSIRSIQCVCSPLELNKYRVHATDRKRFLSAIGSTSAESERLVKLALAGNMAITTAKAVCWLSTGSSAMLSETVHSLVDSGNQALLLIGIRRSLTAPDKIHPCKSIHADMIVALLPY